MASIGEKLASLRASRVYYTEINTILKYHLGSPCFHTSFLSSTHNYTLEVIIVARFQVEIT